MMVHLSAFHEPVYLLGQMFQFTGVKHVLFHNSAF